MLNGKQLLLNEHKLNELMTTKSKGEEANYKKKQPLKIALCLQPLLQKCLISCEN